MGKYHNGELGMMLALVDNGFWRIAHFGRFFFVLERNGGQGVRRRLTRVRISPDWQICTMNNPGYRMTAAHLDSRPGLSARPYKRTRGAEAGAGVTGFVMKYALNLAKAELPRS